MEQCPSIDRGTWRKRAGLVAARAGEKGVTLPILHDLMGHYGYVDQAIVPVIAETLNLSKAEIHGTISFYHDFATIRRAVAPSRCAAPRRVRRVARWLCTRR